MSVEHLAEFGCGSQNVSTPRHRINKHLSYGCKVNFEIKNSVVGGPGNQSDGESLCSSPSVSDSDSDDFSASFTPKASKERADPMNYKTPTFPTNMLQIWD